jgi:hypothetical protein
MILRKFWPVALLLIVGYFYFTSGDDEPAISDEPPKKVFSSKPRNTTPIQPSQPVERRRDQYGYQQPVPHQDQYGYQQAAPYAAPGSGYQQSMPGSQYQFRQPQSEASQAAPYSAPYSYYPQAGDFSYGSPLPEQSYPGSNYYDTPGTVSGYRFRPLEKQEGRKRWEGNYPPPRLHRNQSPNSPAPYNNRPDPYNRSLPGEEYDPLWANSGFRR